ncbi:MAG: class II aldolase/adducin family protein [Pseudomonadota bacterium]
MNNLALRKEIIARCRHMNASGLNQGTSGNISARAGQHMLITPSAVPYDDLTPKLIARMPLDGSDAHDGPLKPSSEWRFHRDILMARPEVGAIVHTHSLHATALSMARKPVPPAHYMVALFGGPDVRCSDYAQFGTQALSDAALTALADRRACLLANHGMITLGRDLTQAMHLAEELETLARQYLLSCAAGGPVLLSDDEIGEALAAFDSYRPG